jgi:hypothetical protein
VQRNLKAEACPPTFWRLVLPTSMLSWNSAACLEPKLWVLTLDIWREAVVLRSF